MAGQLVTALAIETDDGPVSLLVPGLRGVRSLAGIAGIGVRPVVTPRAGRDGSVIRSRFRADRVIVVDGHVRGVGADGVWDEYDAVSRALAGAIGTDRLLYYTLGSGRELQATVRLEELTPGVEVGPDWVPYQAMLHKADPAAYGQLEKVGLTGGEYNLITNPAARNPAGVAPWTPSTYADGLIENFVEQPSGEGPITDWTYSVSSAGQPAASAVPITEWARHGSKSVRYTVTRTDGVGVLLSPTSPGNAGCVVVASDYYAARCSIRLVSVSNGPLDDIKMYIYWYQADGTYISVSALTFAAPLVGSEADLYVIGQAPAAAAFARPGVVYNMPDGVTSTLVADADSFMLTRLGPSFAGPTGTTTDPDDVPAYFDGAYEGYPSGTLHDSKSRQNNLSQVTAPDGKPAFLLRHDLFGGVQDIWQQVSPSPATAVDGEWVGMAAEVWRAPGTPPRNSKLLINGTAGVNDYYSPITALGTAPTRLEVVGQVTGSDTLNLRVYAYDTLDLDTFYVRDVIFCKGSSQAEVEAKIAEYFDGNSPGGYWTGTPDASTSAIYRVVAENTGTVPTPVVVTLRGPLVSPTVDLGDAAHLVIVGDIAGGQALVLDTAARTVRLDGVDRRDLLDSVQSTWADLPPGPVTCALTQATLPGPSAEMELSYRDAFQ